MSLTVKGIRQGLCAECVCLCVRRRNARDVLGVILAILWSAEVRSVLASHEVLRFFPKEIEGQEERQLLSVFCCVKSVLPCRPRSLPGLAGPRFLASRAFYARVAGFSGATGFSLRPSGAALGRCPFTSKQPSGLLPLFPLPASGFGLRPVSHSDVMASGHLTLSSMPGSPVVTHVRGVPQHVCRGPYFFPGLNVLVAFIIPTGGTRLGFSVLKLGL